MKAVRGFKALSEALSTPLPYEGRIFIVLATGLTIHDWPHLSQAQRWYLIVAAIAFVVFFAWLELTKDGE